jgi:hypothetical protein
VRSRVEVGVDQHRAENAFSEELRALGDRGLPAQVSIPPMRSGSDFSSSVSKRDLPPPKPLRRGWPASGVARLSRNAAVLARRRAAERVFVGAGGLALISDAPVSL